MNKMMGKKYAPITKEHTRRWNNMSQAERVAISLKGFAKQNLLDPMKWNFKVKLDGGSRRGYLATKDKTTGKKRGLDSIASENKATAPRDRDVILLPDDGAAIPSERHVNDNLPVLRDPGDDVTSILAREEGAIDQIRVTKWADLGDILSLIPTIKQQSAIKEDILQQMKAWLKEEGRHAKRFEDLMEVRRPHNGPPRGKTVYAKRKLAQFEVLGPYAGILHMTDDSLRKEMRAFGGGAVTAYLWETRAQGRSVSGFQQGNTLSFINTSQLTQTSAAWKHNNVGAVRVGKNLTFYLALENINAGEELLVSYGKNYNPTGLKIKQEHSA